MPIMHSENIEDGEYLVVEMTKDVEALKKVLPEVAGMVGKSLSS